MNYHLTQAIFINLPITSAFNKLWTLISQADGLEAFNHYFTTNKITLKKENSFQRQISLRVAKKITPENQQNATEELSILKINQKVQKNQKQKIIYYKNILSDQSLNKQFQNISGEFYHQFQQNNKGQVYLIFGSSTRNGMKCLPQKSEAQIQLMKLKDMLQNDYLLTLGSAKKKSSWAKCC